MRLCRICQHSLIPRIIQRNYSVGQITIPKRIKRTPTSILEALASTVGSDNKFSPDYRFTDDPALTPTSNMERKKMSLSLEHGRRAAKYFASEWPTLFLYDEDIPRLNSFRPPPTLAASSAPLEEKSLHNFIHNRQVVDAISFYKRMKEDNIQISTDSLLSLMELVAYYNQLDPPPDESDWPEQLFFSSHLSSHLQTPWNDSGLAEELFIELESVAPDQAYSIMIAGLSKHLQGERATRMFQEMMQRGLKPSYEALEQLMTSNFYIDLDSEASWNRIQDYLKYMRDSKMQPLLSTFNQILQFLNKSRRNNNWAKYKALDLFEEMKVCGVKPSAATYKQLIEMFIYLPIRDSLLEVFVDKLENDDSLLHLHDDMDRHTLPWLMRVMTDERQPCPHQLVFRVAQLAQKPNTNLFCESSTINSFYSNFLTYLVINQPLSTFFKWYNEIVPILFTPNRFLMDKILFALEADAAYAHLPRVWQDALTYAMLFNKETVEPLLQLTLNALTSKDIIDKRELKCELVRSVVHWAGSMDKQYVGESIVHLKWDVPLLVTSACIALIGGFPERAWQMCSRVQAEVGGSESFTGRKWLNGDKEYSLLGAPDYKSLRIMFDYTIDAQISDTVKYERCMFLVKLASSYRMTHVSDMAQAITNIPLTPAQMKAVKNYVRQGVIKE